VDHATIQCWVYKFVPLLESEMKKRKGRVGARWRLNQAYIKVKCICCYLYRVVDKLGNTVDFLLNRKRQRISAKSFIIKLISNNYKPGLLNIDKSGSNSAVFKVYNKCSFSKIKIRQCKYLNNIIEQDHRFIKWRIQNGLGFKNFESAKRTLSGSEAVPMLQKNQMVRSALSMFKLCCKLAG
jgi:putative transposase